MTASLSTQNCGRAGGGLCSRSSGAAAKLKLKIDQAKQQLEATLEEGEPMTLAVSGERHEIHRDEPVISRIK